MNPRRERRLLLALAGSAVVLTGALFSGWDPVTPTAEAAENTLIQQCPDPASPGMREVLDALKSKERALDRREKSIDSREGDLRQVEGGLQDRLDELNALREELRTLLQEADADREDRVNGLVKMVEGMRAKQAAPMFTTLEEDLAVDILNRMNRAKAGKLLAALSAKKAASLAEQLTEPVLWGQR
jgi:flagellar motility protein MotE (MotC chaperone)